LEVALRLAGVDNPTINLARERISEALAVQLAACSLLLPSVNVGGNFRLHRGALQDDPGPILRPNSQSLYLGAGAGAVGTGTVAFPGVWLFAHLGDAVYEPLAARQSVTVRRADAQAVQNAVLLDVAAAYLQLAGAAGALEVVRQAEADAAEVARLTRAFAKAGEGAPADANRAAANADLIRRQVREAEGALSAASARLSRLLSLDPSEGVRPPTGAVEPVRLLAEDTDTESLVAAAVRSRPETLGRSAAVQEARTRERQERVRPWFPLVAVGYSAGAFGGGSNQVAEEFGPLQGRSDFAVIATWTLQGLGVGNVARTRRADAVVAQAVADYEGTLNQIRREVAEAQAQCKATAKQIEAARAALVPAEEGFRLDTERIRLGQGRPIEVLDSLRQLVDARLEFVRAVVAFDVAQFRLFVALGTDPAAGLHAPCGEPASPRSGRSPTASTEIGNDQ
jgi:outer membrane protein TolC